MKQESLAFQNPKGRERVGARIIERVFRMVERAAETAITVLGQIIRTIIRWNDRLTCTAFPEQ